jgi:hypothetical protein
MQIMSLFDRLLTRRRAPRGADARRDPRSGRPERPHREPMPRMRWYQ